MVAPPRPALAPSVVLHDRANLVALPLIGTLVLAGLLGFIDTMLVSQAGAPPPVAPAAWPPPPTLMSSLFPRLFAQVTKSFILYIVADFFWILLEPKAVPSQPRIILVHHAITFLLLQIPLKHPQLGRYTCMVRGAEHLRIWGGWQGRARRVAQRRQCSAMAASCAPPQPAHAGGTHPSPHFAAASPL